MTALKQLGTFFSLFFLVISIGYGQAQEEAVKAQYTPEQLVQMQLTAYNNHDLEAFLVPYSEDVEIYNFPNELVTKGKANMRARYGFLQRSPDLHCTLVNRIVVGNSVIDQEKVIFDKNRPPVDAIAIYKIRDGKIATVTFVRND